MLIPRRRSKKEAITPKREGKFRRNRSPRRSIDHDPALRLLQHIRDEAHHFANSFNAELRSKRLKESILDDFKGLGTKRKQQLLQHFGSLEKLRSAKVDQLTQVEGIGKLTAERLMEFLSS